MESVQSIKRRLKSINNIGQITKAMELVAATKMRKSQEIALNSRAYSYAALDLLARLSGQEGKLPALLKERKAQKKALVLVTSDKGLAGSFNSAVIRLFEKYLKEHPSLRSGQANGDVSFIAVGKKAAAYLQQRGFKTKEKFFRVGDFTTPEQTNPISDFLAQGYIKKEWDEVLLFSTYFQSALKQQVLARKIFPVKISFVKEILKEIVPQTGKFSNLREKFTSEKSDKVDEYLIEPAPEKVLDLLVNHLVRMQFYHLILETNASEHAARRMAMKAASDNAKDLFTELTIVFNKSRQAGITKEITEIVSGIESANN
jgi:F-type H+-transporting ATPase subunit gamma